MNADKEFDKKLIDRLKRDVEQCLDRNFAVASDFTFLSDALLKSGRGYVSPTTLKRVWGYISDKGQTYNPSKFTLRALCGLIGFRSLDEYRSKDSSVQSVEYSGASVDSHSLAAGVVVALRWNPNRRVRIQHLGAGRFRVIENANSRLNEGDEVECGSFTQNAPAYMRVSRGGKSPVTYVAGSAQGVNFAICSPE